MLLETEKSKKSPEGFPQATTCTENNSSSIIERSRGNWIALVNTVNFLPNGRIGCHAITADGIEPPQPRLFVILFGDILLTGTGFPCISVFQPWGCLSSPAKGIQMTGEEALARSPLCNTSGHFPAYTSPSPSLPSSNLAAGASS